jgi:hypothetical protein
MRMIITPGMNLMAALPARASAGTPCGMHANLGSVRPSGKSVPQVQAECARAVRLSRRKKGAKGMRGTAVDLLLRRTTQIRFKAAPMSGESKYHCAPSNMVWALLSRIAMASRA